PPSPARMPIGPDGYLVLKEIVFSNDSTPPVVPNGLNRAVVGRARGDELVAIADAYQHLTFEAIDRWKSNTMTDDDIALLNWILENGLFDCDAANATDHAAAN